MRERFGTNTIIAVFLLLMLVTFGGDEIIRLIATEIQVVEIDEAFPCSWLPTPEDLSNRQSLIGRQARQSREPLELRVRASTVPQAQDGLFVIRILVMNNTLGTVPFVYAPNEVIIGDNNTSGLGVIFDPPANIVLPGVNLRNDPTTYPASRIRLLGPQQRCLHKVTLTRSQLPAPVASGTATLQAYYRGVSAGQVPQAQAPNPTPIYPDQGLYTGVILSPTATIPPAS
jgi:hypothetical protein